MLPNDLNMKRRDFNHYILYLLLYAFKIMDMEKFYFEQDFGTCTQKCLVKNNGIMIGSVKCQNCQNCKDYDKDIHNDTAWIKCSKLELALGE